VALLLMTVGFLAFGSGASADGGGLGECALAEDAGVYAFVGLPLGSSPQRIGDGCGYSKCQVTIEDPYAPTRCRYGRTGVVIRGRAASPERAEAFVVKTLKRPGYKQARVGADLAAIATGPSGGIVALSVRRITVVFALGAFSATENSPSYNARRQLKAGARTIAGFLRSNG
jgi:hypothetical protein